MSEICKEIMALTVDPLINILEIALKDLELGIKLDTIMCILDYTYSVHYNILYSTYM